MSEKYFVFINMDNPIVKSSFGSSRRVTSAGFTHALANPEFRVKYLSGSADYLPFMPNPKKDNLGSSLFSLSVTDNYRAEYNAEVHRKQFFPCLPSRLSCIYAFKDYSQCQKAIRKHKWLESNIIEMYLEEHPLNRVHKANMEIVSLVRGFGHTSCLSPEDEQNVWRHYWEGKGDITIESPLLGRHSSGEIWEYLIEGSLVCKSHA